MHLMGIFGAPAVHIFAFCMLWLSVKVDTSVFLGLFNAHMSVHLSVGIRKDENKTCISCTWGRAGGCKPLPKMRTIR